MWIGILVSSNLSSYRTYEIDGQKVTIACGSYCDYIDRYGDKDTLRILATIGIRKVTYASTPSGLNDDKITITVEDPSGKMAYLTIDISGKKVNKIYNHEYSSLIYYSSNSADQIIKYPSQDKIDAFEAKAAEERTAKAAELQKAEQQEAIQKASEPKVPSSVDTAVGCENEFHSRYPYKGSTVHSILGVITNDPYNSNSRLYKVGVTIQNAFGASYDATMECLVALKGSTLTIQTFNVY